MADSDGRRALRRRAHHEGAAALRGARRRDRRALLFGTGRRVPRAPDWRISWRVGGRRGGGAGRFAACERDPSRRRWARAARPDHSRPHRTSGRIVEGSQAVTAPPVLVDSAAGAVIITINRPETRNAINRAVSDAIAEAIDRLDSDASLSVGTLTGAGGHFCSGMDLKAFIRGERVELEGRGLAGLVEKPPRKPLIAAVEGYALAGGFEIALACDLLVAGETAQFGIPEVRRGLIAGSGGLLRLPQKMPRQIAMEYALTGRMMSAAEARQWGLVN